MPGLGELTNKEQSGKGVAVHVHTDRGNNSYFLLETSCALQGNNLKETAQPGSLVKAGGSLAPPQKLSGFKIRL